MKHWLVGCLAVVLVACAGERHPVEWYIVRGNIELERGAAKKALAYYTRANKLYPDEAICEYRLGSYYAIVTPEDHDTVIGWWRRAAAHGSSEAAYQLGRCCYWGLRGLGQEAREAERWFTLAAEKGHPEACELLVFMYRTGAGVPQNEELAMRWRMLSWSVEPLWGEMDGLDLRCR